MHPTETPTPTTLDPGEVEKFSRLAAEWWNPTGKMGVLHKFNPVRLAHIREMACQRFGRDRTALDALTGLSVLDIGCGGGLLCEPLARMGASVTGIDPARTNVETARLHAKLSGLDIDYRCTTAEERAAAGASFDIVLAMEVVEHVADVALFVRACSALVKPGGLLVMATINRTMKSYALAIVGAEYVLRWLPRGTHEWDKFVTPADLAGEMTANDLSVIDRKGVRYDLLRDRWVETSDLSVNYMLTAGRG
ncbi:bifunctional 2-polyprenyl-6-hydroxyphenol methylase/3-demethylubiquinol 3-O-methyltransferase UbiG [Phreatobacter sp.]|uniref:bifunctional 2-polyprenyl-6-hydroxyphenol methylase/3-demethylubiquinol 3-O-methyltransferase UbiG n=1 Tax=Phreatobacter sp. TaxID=1966341 RepID=UPI0025F4B348|nr:bifunctional 2-polyprenyl-6-hydroxyphenol methylase/3-demethylubiquinol 3-O-methyltransferase UbiG [Phreatobacter sp.]